MHSRAWVEIDLDAVRTNVTVLRQHLGAHIHLMAVVKADAYGHGAIAVARAALSAGAAWLGVATVAEGVALRQAGIRAPVLLLAPFAPEEAGDLIARGLTPAVGDRVQVEALARQARRPGVAPEIHLEIDTGMGRAGVQPEEACTLYRQAVQHGLCVSGLCTHFADADGSSTGFTREQIRIFHTVRTRLEALGARFTYVHLCNSAGIQQYGAAGGNLVRPGLLLYGIGALPVPVVPALTLKARVATVRDLPAGANISYGLTCRLRRPGRVATVLIGYGDGYSRRLSNRGCVLIRGRRAPVLGRVCMDQTVVDVTDIPDVAPGDEAVCVGAQGDQRLTVQEIARLCGATEHEVPTGLMPRVPRYYRNERASLSPGTASALAETRETVV